MSRQITAKPHISLSLVRSGETPPQSGESFVARARIAAPAEFLFNWHARPSALEELTPPWEHLEILERAPSLHDGARGAFRVRLGPFRVRWVFEHRDYQQGRQFRDVQISGPFKRWEHTHLFLPDGPDACWLEDRVVFEMPFGSLGQILGGPLVLRKLARLFEYRHHHTAEAMAALLATQQPS
jgi:ligand-binding SRPBCC domain-containing protein